MELNQFRDIYNDVTWTGANNTINAKRLSIYLICEYYTENAPMKFSITALQAQVPGRFLEANS